MKTQSRTVSLIAAVILTAILLLLAFRLTAAETVRDTLSQKEQTLAALADRSRENPGPLPFVGPAYTTGYAAIMFFLAGGAAFVAGRVGVLSRGRLLQLGLIGGILGFLVGSVLHAETRFPALVGAMDLAASLMAAWTVAVLCQEGLLGFRGRQAVVAGVVAILALAVAKGLVQYFVEYPDMLEYVKEHKAEVLRAQGIGNDPAQEQLFMHRLLSGEVTGYGAFSNVYATEMAGLVGLLVAVLVAAVPLLRRVKVPAKVVKGRVEKKVERPGEKEIPLPWVAFGMLVVLLVLGWMALLFTDSKGGVAVAVLGGIVLVVGGMFPERVRAWRKMLLIGLAVGAVVAPVAVVAWGLTFHGLPSKSLLFRWQYWMGTAPMVREHPVWGVGLHNFGDYYLRFKMPSSPEDVKDPHSFFVRLAAEAGLPAAVAVGGLLLWMVVGALRRGGERSDTNDKTPGSPGVAIPGFARVAAFSGAAAVLWIPLHFLAEIPNEYSVLVMLLFTIAAWAMFVAAWYLMDNLPPARVRFVALAATITALAMLLYDQINMALVTGPAAMLFWVLLGVGDCDASKAEVRKPKVSLVISSLLVAAGLAVVVLVTVPVGRGSFDWDPAPYELQYLRDMSGQNYERAVQDLNGALERWPNSTELLVQRIRVNWGLNRSTAEDIRRVLKLDRSNAAPRRQLALPDSDLPAAERMAALREALAFDQQLPEGEFKRLSGADIESIKQTIDRLSGALTQPSSTAAPLKN